MGGRHVQAARRLLTVELAAELPEHGLALAARDLVDRLGRPDRLLELVAELAAGEGEPEECARLSYRHVLGFDKLLLIDGGPRHMLRAHVWHPGRGGIGREDIHNHRSPLASCVVRGRLAMELYETADGDGDLTTARYRESLAAGSANWRLAPAGPARLRLTHAARIAAGSAYALPAHTLHRAWCDTEGPTVTLFLETGTERRRHTDVFTAAGPHPDAVAKVPMAVPDYLDALNDLAELLRAG
ncbi:hypothetical protein [Streptomyces sp. NPDC006997]|uniref:hypothetical protein n=1 Tax=Streptomyces sp. NPDC006997 TaxID=3155356 RepID=UPI0033FFE892